MNPLVEAVDEAVAFVRSHPDAMTRAEVDRFKELADRVWLLTPDNWLARLPRVPELRPELASQEPPLPEPQFVGKLNLPGDWDYGTFVGKLPLSYPLCGVLPDNAPLVCESESTPLPERTFLVCATPRWFTDMEALRRLAASTETTAPEQTPTPAPLRLTVDLACKTITLDGRTYDVGSECALRWIAVLAAHPGEWISSPELRSYDEELDGCKTHRVKEHLPQAVLDLLDSETGKGSRLRL